MPTQQNAYITKCLHYKMPNNKLIFDFDSRTDGSTVYLAGETWGQHRKQRLHVYKHTYSLWIHEIAGIAIKNLWKYSCKNVSSCHIKQRKAINNWWKQLQICREWRINDKQLLEVLKAWMQSNNCDEQKLWKFDWPVHGHTIKIMKRAAQETEEKVIKK